MLHGIREGVIALDRVGRVRLLNDEALRLLGLDAEAIGQPLDDVLGPGRTTDVLAGRVTGTDLLTVRGQRVLVANRMPTDDGGAVATLRDRTELEQLGRELDSTHGLIDALRAQDHEHANRMHTVLGLLELEMYDDAVEFVGEVVGDHRVTAEQVTEKIHDPLLAALLVGKATVAAERGVALWVADGTLLPDRLVDPRGLVTVVGNLVDNALDAVAGTPHARVEVELHAEGRTAVLRVRDTGPGIPAERRELIFTDGWSTKKPPAHGKRGLGLSLVRRLAERQGGSAEAAEADGGARSSRSYCRKRSRRPVSGRVDSLVPAEGLEPAEGLASAKGLMPGPEGEPGRGPAPELVRQPDTLSQNTTGATAATTAEEESR